MLIALKSEIDSRVILYPMMRVLRPHGSVIVVTRNRQLKRLIDDMDYSTFRNISIIVDEAGATDDVFEIYGIAPDDYDFIIMDNMGITDYDLCFFLFGDNQSEGFMNDKDILEQSDEAYKVIFADFSGGKAIKEKTEKTKPEKQSKHSKKRGDADEEEEIPEGFDPAAKYHDMVRVDNVNHARRFSVSFPTFAEIEQMEGGHRFYDVPNQMISMFYEAFGNILNIDQISFRKEVRLKDEGRNNL